MTRHPTVADVVAAACTLAGLSEAAIFGRRKDRDVVTWRWAVMQVSWEMCGCSNNEIGRRMGNRDHSTVLHGRARSMQLCQTMPEYADRLAAIRAAAPGAAEKRRAALIAATKQIVRVPENRVPEKQACATDQPRAMYRDGRRGTTQAGHIDRHGNLICNP